MKTTTTTTRPARQRPLSTMEALIPRKGETDKAKRFARIRSTLVHAGTECENAAYDNPERQEGLRLLAKAAEAFYASVEAGPKTEAAKAAQDAPGR